MSKRYSEQERAFFESMILPQDDLPKETWAKYQGGYRWFRAPNVIAIENYRPAPTTFTKQ